MQIHARHVRSTGRCPTATAGSAAEAATPTTPKTHRRCAMRPHQVVVGDQRPAILIRRDQAPDRRSRTEPTSGPGGMPPRHPVHLRVAPTPNPLASRDHHRPHHPQSAHPPASSPPSMNDRLCCRTPCRSAANAKLVFERSTAARSCGRSPRRRGISPPAREQVWRSAAATAGSAAHLAVIHASPPTFRMTRHPRLPLRIHRRCPSPLSQSPRSSVMT
jgi:hypothetical protein